MTGEGCMKNNLRNWRVNENELQALKKFREEREKAFIRTCRKLLASPKNK